MASYILRLPTGVGMGGEAGMLQLPEEFLVGPMGVNRTLEFALEHEGQYSMVAGFWAGEVVVGRAGRGWVGGSGWVCRRVIGRCGDGCCASLVRVVWGWRGRLLGCADCLSEQSIPWHSIAWPWCAWGSDVQLGRCVVSVTS